MITFACVFVRGYVGYSPLYPQTLLSMMRRHYEGEASCEILTDQPDKVSGMGFDKIHTVRTPPDSHPWWAKLELFAPGRFEMGRRVCYLDLDVLVWRNLNPIVEYPARFALVPHAGQFNGKGLRKVIKKYNSSVMVWHAGELDDLYTEFTPLVMSRLWGDQDWIGERRPYERRMPLAWFPRLSEFDAMRGHVPEDARVVLCKRPKNVEAANQWSWFMDAWR